MSVLLFIIILGALIFVHELGHFLLAKKNGIRVDEFAVGFPPKIIGFRRGETNYSLNLIPFGGYVKIFGENPDEESLDKNATDSFVNKSAWVQAAVLVAGVVFNIVFAWFLFLVILMTGMPAAVTSENAADIKNAQVVITGVFPDSPAENAGLQPGDSILSISNSEESRSGELLTTESVKEIVTTSETETVLQISRAGEILDLKIEPISGITGEEKAIGISMDRIGERELPFYRAVPESFRITGESIKTVFVGLGTLFGSLFSGTGSLDQVSGPVGIVNLVDSAAQFGLANILAFTAFLSINLAVLNIMPFPALDGGRLLFLGLEGVFRRKIKPVVANTLNAVGFMILIGFMLVITVNDVLKLF